MALRTRHPSHPRVEKDLKAIDRAMQREILDYMDTRIATDEDPRRFGKPLRHELRGLWRYRVRDYRIICDIREQNRVVFVLTVKHRSTGVHGEVVPDKRWKIFGEESVMRRC